MYMRQKKQSSQEESIYNLIQQQQGEAPSATRYVSRYPPNAPPTASTFGRGRFSQVSTTNVAGEYNEVVPSRHPHANWGPKGDIRPDTTQFLKKQTRYDAAQDPAHSAHHFTYSDRRKSPLIVTPTEASQYTSPSSASQKKRNFIHENTMNAVTMKPSPAVIKESDVDYTKKPDYGRVPNYLDNIKTEIGREKEYINYLMEQQRVKKQQAMYGQQPKMRQLDEEERLQMIYNLKEKWNEVNREYQKTTHIVNLDSHGKIRRKEEYEQQLNQLEKSIEKLSKQIVYVVDN